MDLRLLGLWKDIPLAPLTRATVPIAACGFVVAATTGAGLLSANATEYAGNPFLLIKFTAIPLGLLNAMLTRRLTAWRARGLRALTPTEAAATRPDRWHLAHLLADGCGGGTDDRVLVIYEDRRRTRSIIESIRRWGANVSTTAIDHSMRFDSTRNSYKRGSSPNSSLPAPAPSMLGDDFDGPAADAAAKREVKRSGDCAAILVSCRPADAKRAGFADEPERGVSSSFPRAKLPRLSLRRLLNDGWF